MLHTAFGDRSVLSRELGHGKGTRIWRGILRQEIDDSHLNHWILAEISWWSQNLPQTWNQGLKAQRANCCHLSDIHMVSLCPVCWGHYLHSQGRKLRVCVCVGGVNPTMGSKPRTFCSISSILPYVTVPPHQHTDLCIFSPPYLALDLSGFLSFSLHLFTL